MEGRNTELAHKSSSKADQQAALHKGLLLIEAFRAVRPIMPLNEVYAFLFVALQEGLNVQEYANRAGVTQPVMTRILFALGSRGRGRKAGYGLVQQLIDPEDARKHQTFLTAKGAALMREIVRLTRSDRQHAMKLRKRNPDLVSMAGRSPRELAREQWLARLIAVGRKLDPEDIKLAVRQTETILNHRRG